MTRTLTKPPTDRAFKLRSYQAEALDAVVQSEERGIRRPLVVLPTGTGKTVVIAHLIQRRAGRALILAHRDELLRQARDKLAMVMPEADIGLVKAGSDETEASVVLERVMNLGENRIGMRVIWLTRFPAVARFPHSQAISHRVHNSL